VQYVRIVAKRDALARHHRQFAQARARRNLATISCDPRVA
jgi:hypothetical protein